MTRYTIHPDPDRPGFYVVVKWLSDTCRERLPLSYSSVSLCCLDLDENVKRVPAGERRDLEAVVEVQ